MPQRSALIDTDTLSEIIKQHDPEVASNAQAYLKEHQHFRFSIITRYEILRGLKSKGAFRQAKRFAEQCRVSEIVPLSDEVVDRAADVYSDLRKRGLLIEDGDILIAATAIVHGWVLVTENRAHFNRIPSLSLESWRKEKPK